ncbi:hypothetical protein L914_21089 [Phytophthora nicotianae]|uniref:Uncharacterized protein n=1 Tax=Phytophthora nicotianae TaxID=4792 RepID=W2M739_PHYNI|nr:hypothetical protein L914_21089 [Phytophthora nicotianae]
MPTTAANAQIKLATITTPDTTSSVRSLLNAGDSTNKPRGAVNTSGRDEERGFFSSATIKESFSNAKIKALLKLRIDPKTVNKLLSPTQRQAYYAKLRDKMTVELVKKLAAREKA